MCCCALLKLTLNVVDKAMMAKLEERERNFMIIYKMCYVGSVDVEQSGVVLFLLSLLFILMIILFYED